MTTSLRCCVGMRSIRDKPGCVFIHSRGSQRPFDFPASNTRKGKLAWSVSKVLAMNDRHLGGDARASTVQGVAVV